MTAHPCDTYKVENEMQSNQGKKENAFEKKFIRCVSNSLREFQLYSNRNITRNVAV